MPKSQDSVMSKCGGVDRRCQRAGPFLVSDTLHAPGTRLAHHDHEEACLHVVISGQYQESTRDTQLSAVAGDTLLKGPGLEHWNDFGPLGARTIRVRFKPDALGSIDSTMPSSLVHRSDPGVASMVPLILRELREQRPSPTTTLQGLCLALLGVMAGPARRQVPLVERASAMLAARSREPIECHAGFDQSAQAHPRI